MNILFWYLAEVPQTPHLTFQVASNPIQYVQCLYVSDVKEMWVPGTREGANLS